MLDLMGKLGELVFGSLGELWKLMPERLRKDAQARLRDQNPFAATPANEDLLRGLRLAWIEVALKIDKAVAALATQPEWQGDAQEIQRFSTLVRTRLVAIRSRTFDRDTSLPSSAIDRHLQAVLAGVPQYVVNRAVDPGDDIGRPFGVTLAAVVDWPADEVPASYRQVAMAGIAEGPGEPPRAFGELVFATFADFVKHPTSHPETAAAFQIAQVEIARGVAMRTLGIARGLDARFDALLQRLDAAPYRTLDDFTAQAQSIASGLAQLAVKVEALPNREQFAQIIEQAVSASLQRELADVARSMGGWLAHSPTDQLPADLLRRVTDLYGHPDLPVNELVPTLRRYALAYRELQQGVARGDTLQRYDADTRRELMARIAAGDIGSAEGLMARTLARQQKVDEDLGRQRAATWSDRARLAFLRDDLAGVCLCLRDARHAVRHDRRLAWAYALQTYSLLCRERRAEEAHEWGPDLAGTDIAQEWERFADPFEQPGTTWAWRERIAADLDIDAGIVIADGERFRNFRSWSSRINATANTLLDLARQSRNPFEARAALAGFGLFSASFHTADDPIDIDINAQQIDEARSLLLELERPLTGRESMSS